MSVEAITWTGYTEAQVADFLQILAGFEAGKMYIANGVMTKSEADTGFADQTAMATTLTPFTLFSDLAEDPGKEGSKVEKLKTKNYVKEGKRTNTIELNLVGLSQNRKDWLEKELNKSAKTIVLVDVDETSVLVFSGLTWSYEREAPFTGLYTGVIATEFTGLTKDKYFIYKEIPPAS